MLFSECLDLYQELSAKRSNIEDGVVQVQTMPKFGWARIGVKSDAVMLILPSDGLGRMANHELEYIRIHPNAEFKVRDELGERIERVAYVSTKGCDGWLVRSFFELIAMLFESGVDQTPESIRQLLDDLVSLFRALTQSPLKTLIGLWGELFLIYRSTSPDVLIAAWHSTPRDRFDFARAHERIEVKTTTGPRIHNFAHSQLVMSPKIRVTIASLVLNRSDSGSTCAELTQMILTRLTDVTHRRKFLEQVVSTMGEDWSKQDGEAFDIEQAALSLKFFDAGDVPKIEGLIPPEVSNVKYKVDLQSVRELRVVDLGSQDFLTLTVCDD